MPQEATWTTVGAEEELLLADAVSGRPAPCAAEVLAGARPSPLPGGLGSNTFRRDHAGR